MTYGGPGLWLVKIDPNGNIGTCSCGQDTNTTPQALDLQGYPASFTGHCPGLRSAQSTSKARRRQQNRRRSTPDSTRFNAAIRPDRRSGRSAWQAACWTARKGRPHDIAPR